MTTFQLISKKTGLVLAAQSVSNPQASVVVLADKGAPNTLWRFQWDQNHYFEVTNATTQMAIGIEVLGGSDRPSGEYVEWPVEEMSAATNATLVGPLQEWSVRYPSPSSKSFGDSFLELIISPLGNTQVGQWVLNVPDRLLSAFRQKNGANAPPVGLPVQISPGNDGQDNEQWTLQPTASPQPSISFAGTSGPPGNVGFSLNFTGTGFTPNSSVALVSVPLLPPSVVGVSPESLATVDANGNLWASLNFATNDGSRVGGQSSGDTQVTVAVLGEDNYVLAFGVVASSYWYINTDVEGVSEAISA